MRRSKKERNRTRKKETKPTKKIAKCDVSRQSEENTKRKETEWRERERENGTKR